MRGPCCGPTGASVVPGGRFSGLIRCGTPLAVVGRSPVTAWVAVSYGGGGVGLSGSANADGAVIVSAAIMPRVAADQAVVRLSILTISTSRCTAVLRSSRNDRMLWAAARERPIRCFTLSSRFVTPAPDLTARSGVASALHETTTSANGHEHPEKRTHPFELNPDPVLEGRIEEQKQQDAEL